ncbi:MAG: hypothetical protein AB7V56_17350 [Candidatus Nitrosocosmicus sp.]|jgi:hypothetical protein|uniref:hypothetical protein n=1 Tax=Candidatus Nitrosocosmicus agrestis TaxID=2563600 RepID=UPI00122E0C78|nr:hypothetical protein [Candidatus Nitrosocosmicus sp. SS]KAA2280113.1 hypothetical protein F1Z66_12165 [Candidatus Nitrosocosmicus sp. SS]KAF0868264.1 hypothetical protein E5N71_10685 [Candidatus Nitrosocosmicus sp. SS]MDR4492574.1 hypothetical protein [Candidatus Nitrosocosmicus sp.]
MDKTSISQEENGALRNAETFVLDKLFDKSGLDDYLVNLGELITSIDTALYPLLDQAIEDLVAQSLIRSEDGENYQIMPDGINELKNRKREPIPL